MNLWSIIIVYAVDITKRVWRVSSESYISVIVFHDLHSHGSLELWSEGLQTVRHVTVETVFPFLIFNIKILGINSNILYHYYLIWFTDSAGVKTE